LSLPIETSRSQIIDPPALALDHKNIPNATSLIPVSYTMSIVRPGWPTWIVRKVHRIWMCSVEDVPPMRWTVHASAIVLCRLRGIVRRALSPIQLQIVKSFGRWLSAILRSQPTSSRLPRARLRENDQFLFMKASPEPEIAPPIVRQGLAGDELRRLLQERETSAVFAPIGMLATDIDETGLASQPLVVIYPDFAVEYTDAFGPWTRSAAREQAVWSRLAGISVFTSEHDRAIAVKRYGLRSDQTRVVTGALVARGLECSSHGAAKETPPPDPVPERYILGTGSRDPQANLVLLFEAYRVLRWRRVECPPLVLVGEAPKKFSRPSSACYEEALDVAGIGADLTVGRNLFPLPPLGEQAGAHVDAAALVRVVTDRWSADACLRICRAALNRCPVIAVAGPAVVEEWGPSDDAVLLVPADDPAALADAMQYTLAQPEATARRVERALQKAQALCDPKQLNWLQRLLEEVAAQQKSSYLPPNLRKAG
jgi:hypothetical protein